MTLSAPFRLQLLVLLPIGGCAVFWTPPDQVLDADKDGYPASEDCNDEDPSIGIAFQAFDDLDGDGFGDPGTPTSSCDPTDNRVEDATDCDDADASVNPSRPERCDGRDEDCDGTADEEAVDALEWWSDPDGDGYGQSDVTTTACDAPAGFVAPTPAAEDCAGSDASAFPGAWEVCGDGVDQDCDGRDIRCLPVGVWDISEATRTRLVGEPGDNAGNAVAFSGDVDADGFQDVLVGAYAWDAGGPGRAYLAYGPATSTPYLTEAGAILLGETSGGHLGNSVAGIGDLNVDGYDDVAVADPSHTSDTLHEGAVYVSYGPVTGTMSASDADVVFEGVAMNAETGRALARAGDMNADGDDDLAIGACEWSEGSARGVYLIEGGALFLGPHQVTEASTVLSGESALDWFGYAVSSADDVNGDGHDDLVVGAIAAAGGQGAAYLFYGPLSGDVTVSSSVSTLEGTTFESRAGWSVASTGDGGVLVGAWTIETTFLVRAPEPGVTSLSAADAIFTGTGGNTYFGLSVAGPGDVDESGSNDVVVGAWYESPGGAAFLFLDPGSGSIPVATADATYQGASSDDYTGSVSMGGDVNGDGFEDILVGASGNDLGGPEAGAVYLILGGKP